VGAVTSIEMAAAELNARYLGVTELQLMENAGAEVAREVASRFTPGQDTVAVLSGTGGNGGDGFVAARHLAGLGFKVSVILVGRPSEITNESARTNWETLVRMRESVKVLTVPNSDLMPELTTNVIVDALLGTGVKGALRPPLSHAVKKLNQAQGFKVSVDIPSGIDADTGEALGGAVKADVTVALHRSKTGLAKATPYVGKLKAANIGIPPEAERFAGPGDVLLAVKPRPVDSHKGDFGRLLIVGGSETYTGAPALVALAALRTGVDLAYVVAPEKAAYAISSISPDLITVKAPGDHLTVQALAVVEPMMEKATALVVGPGLGLHPETQEAVEKLFKLTAKMRLPTLMDADALKAYGRFKRAVDFPLVLTPHAGEYKALTGEALPQRVSEKVPLVEATARALRSVLVLKGPVDIITDGDHTKLNFTGNQGMTVGGTGDVLSGIAGALLSQGVPAYVSGVAAAFINGGAGDMVAKERGFHMVATDLLDKIPQFIELCLNRRVEEVRHITLAGKSQLTLI